MVNHHRLLTKEEKLKLVAAPVPEALTSGATSDGKVTVNATWYSQAQGVVAWNFTNTDTVEHSVVLYRNSYIFGGAFWPVYIANAEFSTSLLDGTKPISPLTNNGVANNSMPMAIITNTTDLTQLNGAMGGNAKIAFIFTLAPGQSWSELEGGFSSFMPPAFQGLFYVTGLQAGNYCIGYDPAQVTDWDTQTGTSLGGYTPNPKLFNTYALEIEQGKTLGTFLFSNQISYGTACTPAPQPTCLQEIEQGIEQGNLELFVEGIICVFETGSLDIKKGFKLLLHKLVEKL